MPAKNFGWVAALALMAGLAACNPDVTQVSPGVSDQNQLEGALLVDTFRLEGSTYLYDSCLASEWNILPVGVYQNPATGRAVSTGFFDFSLPLTTYAQLNAGLSFDSLVLRMPYAWEHTPVLNRNMTVELHRLTQPLSRQSVFLTRDQATYDPAVLATAVVRDSSERNAAGELVFYLPASVTDLGPKLLALGQQAAYGTTYDAVTKFSQNPDFYGFALVPTGTNTPVANIQINASRLALYASRDSIAKPGKDSLAVGVAFGLLANNRFYSHTEADRTGSETAALTPESPSLPANAANGYRAYVQNLTALWARVQFPSYIAYRRAHPELTLVKAQLVLPQDPVPASYNGPLNKLLPWQGSADHFAVGRNGFFAKGLPNGFSTSLTTPDGYYVSYNATTNTYVLDMTAYLKAIEAGSVYNSGLLLSAPVGVPMLAPFTFNMLPAAQDNGRRAKLQAYFVELNR